MARFLTASPQRGRSREVTGLFSGVPAQYPATKSAGHVPRSFPLTESCTRSRRLGDRPLALDSLRAFRSGDVAEATLVAARNLPGRLGTGDDTQEILKSLDELLVHGFGQDVNLRTVIDDAACGSCPC